MAIYWNSYFGQYLDDEDNDIPNDMPNDESNDSSNEEEDFEEELDNENIIHFDESELEWWKDIDKKIKDGTLFKNNRSIDKCSKK